MSRTLYFNGPKFHGKPLQAFIILKKNRTTWSVRWDVGSIDTLGAPSDTFSKRGEASGILNELVTFVNANRSKWKTNWVYWGGYRWGSLQGVPETAARKVFRMMAKSYRTNVKGLPLHYFESA